MPYAVMIGLQGLYMPNNVSHFRTRKDAESSARWWAETFREDGEKVSGSARAGYYEVGEHECIEISEIGYEDFETTCSECGKEEVAIKEWKHDSLNHLETTCGCLMTFKEWCRDAGK